MTQRRGVMPVTILLCGALSCTSATTTAPDDGSSGGDTPPGQLVPLNALGPLTYLGFRGGLYPNGDNTVPAAHAAEGARRAAAIRPLDVNGSPSAAGRYVLLSMGMSNTTQEFCSAGSGEPCAPWSFMGKAAADPAVNHSALAIVNGAMGGRAAAYWDSPDDPDYDRVRDTRLAPRGLSEKQVQVVWLKVANPQPTASLPSAASDAYALESQMGDIVRAIRVRYPNVKQVFVSSRIYAGYARSTLNPEPFAYESGLAVKWLVQAQIDQMQNDGVVTDVRAGDLHYARTPWIAWGPYLWANGANPRDDGLAWLAADFSSDGTHPSESGEAKVAALLLGFFTTSPATRCWFIAGERCA